MGNILNPDNEDFSKIVRKSKDRLFVDKTDFLSELIKKIDEEDCFYCFTRPRRFGKTITAKMLSAYFSKGCDSKDLFANLKISRDPSYLTHINKYNVIYIDMNSIQGHFNIYQRKQNKIPSVVDIVDFLEYKIICELKDCHAYQECLTNNNIENIGVFEAVEALNINKGEKFVFILDEWDLIYREFKNDITLQDKYISLLRDLFKSASGQRCFSLAYLTGILPIKKYISESALNNFREYNMLRPKPYERFFGFTEEESEILAKDHNIDFSELKHWYDGYKLNETSIFNPNSVINAISNNCIQSYWTETSSLDSFKCLVNLNFKNLKGDIYQMVVNNAEIQFNSSSFKNDMVSLAFKDDVFSLLVCLGYAACRRTESQNDKEYYAYIPNEEIRISLLNLIVKEDWYLQIHRMEQSLDLYQATCSLDAKKVAEIIESIHTSPIISVDTYNNELSLSYCVTYGYSLAIEHNYNIIKEKPAGKGYADIVFEPKADPTLPVIILELKYGKTASEAIAQIKERHYSKHYVGQYDRILLVGINYDKDTKKHECLIEEFI